ncbi:hypothetical protein I4X03_004935 [Massilia sp. R798]|uniref:Transposase DDE domain-containing protein n=1 Tax=Massilia soli TaxID=2792854 RepID=A0ABS7SKY9_9BURK|nr:hypothetical protein [Massilia soli]
MLKLAGLDWQVLDLRTVSRCQKQFVPTIGAQPTTIGLLLLVDNTGIKTLGECKWNAKKKGADFHCQWS